MADRLSLLLVVGYLAALGLGAYEFRRASSLSLPPPPSEQTAQAVPPLDLPPGVVANIAAYDAIIERPLFSPNRRPEPIDEAATPTDSTESEEAVVEIDGFRLTAVLRDGDSTTVLIEDRTGQTRTLHEGDQLGNWRLGDVLDDRVELIADNRRETLMVYDFSAPASSVRVRRPNRRIAQPRQARPSAGERNAPLPPDQP
jgi:hypothetical protein